MLDTEGSSFAAAVAVDGTSGFVVAGTAAGTRADGTDARVVVARFLSDGSLDPSFGTDGVSTVVDGPPAVGDVVVEPETRKAVVVGLDQTSEVSPGRNPIWEAVAVRLEADGRLDRSFGDSGIARIAGLGEAAEDGEVTVEFSDGRFLVGRPLNSEYRITRLELDGTTSRSFADGGTLRIPDSTDSFSLDRRGRIILSTAAGVNSEGTVHRFTPAGAPDASFGRGGRVILPAQASVITLPDDSVLARSEPPKRSLPEQSEWRRVTADGIDQSFGDSGLALCKCPVPEMFWAGRADRFYAVYWPRGFFDSSPEQRPLGYVGLYRVGAAVQHVASVRLAAPLVRAWDALMLVKGDVVVVGATSDDASGRFAVRRIAARRFKSRA